MDGSAAPIASALAAAVIRRIPPSGGRSVVAAADITGKFTGPRVRAAHPGISRLPPLAP